MEEMFVQNSTGAVLTAVFASVQQIFCLNNVRVFNGITRIDVFMVAFF